MLMDSLRCSLICSHCKELFEEPKALPCGHVFCFRCVNQFNPAICPKCSAPFKIPLPDAEQISAILNVYKTQANSLEINTDISLKDNQSSESNTHEKNIHDSSSWSSSSPSNAISLNSYCSKHRNQAIESFCIECLEKVCNEYIQKDHYSKGHRCVQLRVVKSELQGLLHGYRKKLSNYKNETYMKLYSKTTEPDEIIYQEAMENVVNTINEIIQNFSDLSESSVSQVAKIQNLQHK